MEVGGLAVCVRLGVLEIDKVDASMWVLGGIRN